MQRAIALDGEQEIRSARTERVHRARANTDGSSMPIHVYVAFIRPHGARAGSRKCEQVARKTAWKLRYLFPAALLPAQNGALGRRPQAAIRLAVVDDGDIRVTFKDIQMVLVLYGCSPYIRVNSIKAVENLADSELQLIDSTAFLS